MLRDLPDLLPEFIASRTGFGGEGKEAGGGILLGQRAEGAVQLIVRKAVTFGGDEQEFALGGGKEVQELAVALLGRDIGVDQNDAQAQGGTLVQVRLDEFRPFLRNLARNLGVAVPGRSAKISSGRGFPGQRISKKLMARVRPGVELVRATLSPTRELMTLDLPTFERPRKAISGRVGTGKCAASVADAMKRERTLMLKCATGGGKLASEGASS